MKLQKPIVSIPLVNTNECNQQAAKAELNVKLNKWRKRKKHSRLCSSAGGLPLLLALAGGNSSLLNEGNRIVNKVKLILLRQRKLWLGFYSVNMARGGDVKGCTRMDLLLEQFPHIAVESKFSSYRIVTFLYKHLDWSNNKWPRAKLPNLSLKICSLQQDLLLSQLRAGFDGGEIFHNQLIALNLAHPDGSLFMSLPLFIESSTFFRKNKLIRSAEKEKQK